MKHCLLILALILVSNFVLAGSKVSKETKEFTMTAIDAVKFAGNLLEKGDLKNSETILTSLPQMQNSALEIERWFLLGQISARRGDYDTAIKIFRKILDEQPELARIRFELAMCYMKLGYWYRADYHLRLAMAGDDLSDEVRKMMSYYRYTVRQNKTWNFWFNFGAAPDNNINQGTGGKECINSSFGIFCRELSKPESALGFNFVIGGNYEFKFGEHWRLKSDANVYTNIYNKHNYDDLYLSSSTGPRYVWNNGDVWLSGVFTRRWSAWDKYNFSLGTKLDLNYDFTRKLSGGISLKLLDNKYDEYGSFMNGKTYSANGRLSYSLDATKYIILRTGIERDTALDKMYANWRPSVSLGFGASLPYSFDIYMEPSFNWTNFEGKRWVVYNGKFRKKAIKDFNQRYSISLSNNKFSIWGFVPTLTVSYSRRNSNIWQREYNKYSAEFTFQQKF